MYALGWGQAVSCKADLRFISVPVLSLKAALACAPGCNGAELPDHKSIIPPTPMLPDMPELLLQQGFSGRGRGLEGL